MKGVGLSHIYSKGETLTLSSPTVKVLFMLMSTLALFIWFFCASAQASSLPKKLSLIQVHAREFRPELIEHKALFQALRKDAEKPQVNYLAKQTNLVLNNTLNGLAKSIKVDITPQIVMKPFFLVQELKNALYIYQTKSLKKAIQVDQNFQAKTALQPRQISYLQKLKPKKPFLFSPYQSRIYGLHFQLNFK